VLFALLALAGAAHAQGHGPPVVVLTIDSDDAEEQAEALSAAIRSRVRASSNFTLQDSPNTLGMLTAALRCNKVPDQTCLEKIAGQLKSERFLWGVMQKAPGNQVKVEVHFFEKGRADIVARDIYSDNLRDQNDDTLRAIARKLVDRVTGVTGGTLTVHAGNGGGTVMVDGQKRGTLRAGELTVELPVGGHKLEVHVAGYAPAVEDVNVMLGKDTRVSVSLVKEGELAPAPPETPFPARKVAGGVLIGVGTGLLAGGIVELVHWLNMKSDYNDLAKTNFGAAQTIDPATGRAVALSNPCDATTEMSTMTTQHACDLHNHAWPVAIVGWALTGVGAIGIGTGVYLLTTHSAKEDKKEKSGFALTPYGGPSGAGFAMRGQF
jgi:hypothetical protein